MKVIAVIFNMVCSGMLLFIYWEVFQFHDWDMFLWGGTFYLFVPLVLFQVLSISGMLLTDNYLKNRYYRIISIIILSISFVVTLVRYQFIWKINHMDVDYKRLLYPDLLYERSFPVIFQLTVWTSLAIVLVVLIKRYVKMNKNGR